MASQIEIVNYCNQLLDIHQFKDYCPNGLQVEGKTEINKIISGVTASLAFIEAAIEAQADLLLVHHGFFWRSEKAVITGMKQKRIARLLEKQLNLVAYHLPLDAHNEVGNNIQLAKVCNWQFDGVVKHGSAKHLLYHGHLATSCSAEDFALALEKDLSRKPLSIIASDKPISKIAWCTGAAQHFIEQAIELGVDAFVSGEISENITHTAQESDIHYFAAGHHATERYGVQALGRHLEDKFSIEHQFIDINNPV